MLELFLRPEKIGLDEPVVDRAGDLFGCEGRVLDLGGEPHLAGTFRSLASDECEPVRGIERTAEGPVLQSIPSLLSQGRAACQAVREVISDFRIEVAHNNLRMDAAGFHFPILGQSRQIMKFHYLVSFHLPDVPANEVQVVAMRRALGRFLERAGAELAGPRGDFVPGGPEANYRVTVDTVPAGTVVPVLRSGPESGSSLRRLSRWLQWTPLDVAFAMGICFAGGFLFSVSLGHWIR